MKFVEPQHYQIVNFRQLELGYYISKRMTTTYNGSFEALAELCKVFKSKFQNGASDSRSDMLLEFYQTGGDSPKPLQILADISIKSVGYRRCIHVSK